jgi:hypothetical protein
MSTVGCVAMDARDEADFGGLLGVLAEVDGWIARMGADGARQGPEPGSPMQADDDRLDPYQLSHVCWSSLSHAVDHLSCLRALVRDAHVLHMYAPYTLVRAALENACATVWMLKPPASEDRISRRLRFAVSDIRHGEDARAITGQAGPRTKQERLDQIAGIGSRSGLDPRLMSRAAGYQEIVDAAGDDRQLTELMWRVCSGMAHGDLWTTFAASQLARLPGASPKVGTFAVTANVGLLRQMAEIAALMTRQGWQLYDQRSATAVRSDAAG